MFKLVTSHEKPLSHLNLPDWYAAQWELRQNADVRRSEACQLRNSSKTIRSQGNARTKWDTYINNIQLVDRWILAFLLFNHLTWIKVTINFAPLCPYLHRYSVFYIPLTYRNNWTGSRDRIKLISFDRISRELASNVNSQNILSCQNYRDI